VASFLKSIFGRGESGEEGEHQQEPGAQAPAGGDPQPWFYQPNRNQQDRFPRFKSGAAGTRTGRHEDEEFARARAKLREAFTPSQPVTNKRLFAGRLQVLVQLIEAIEDRLAHVVVFGERGIGKTSLLHILADLARESDYLTLRATCGAGAKFDVMFRNLLQEVPLVYHRSVSPTDEGSEIGANIANLLPDYAFDARELSDLLQGVTSCRVLIILDEYDRIESEAFRVNMAELIKNLSDCAAPVQIVIAGVSSNLHELIGYIPSIRRNVVGLPLPKLSHEEVEEIINLGERASSLQFAPEVVPLIERIAEGSPYLVRLACYHSSLIALESGRMNVLPTDFRDGLNHMVRESAARLSHEALQRSQRLNWVRDEACLDAVAHLAAMPSGWFSILDISEQVGPAECDNLEAFIRKELIPAGLMLEEEGPRGSRYRFVDEGLQSYLWISLARNRMAGGAG
jgi:hypothetical protein